jgi:peptidoglycan/LPS O-acetylase OafA/YrhL
MTVGIQSEYSATPFEPAEARRALAPPRFAYQGSLDGLRALAVLAIIAYHFNYGWARGAYLSVDLFFILSGFLITTLLVLEWQRHSTIALRQFWARRARRLLPALFLVLIFVAVLTRLVIDPWNRAPVRGDGLASLFYVANWRFIADKQGYFELFSAASPLRHMWTLAIEEQFYLVWPLVVFVTLRLGHGSLRILTAVCVVAIGASIAIMAAVYGTGDPLRAYYGTDARAHTILFGALLALLLVTWSPSATAQRRLASLGTAAFVAMLVAWHFATGTSARYYHGGSAAYAVLACIVIAGALQPGKLRTVLSFGPLAWIGRLSYGIYLFHWPIIVWLVPSRVHLTGMSLNLLRLVVTFLVATLSYYLIELPVRERRLRTLAWRRSTRSEGPRAVGIRFGVVFSMFAVVVTIAIVLASATGATPPPSYLSGSRTPPTFPAATQRSDGHASTQITFATPKVNFIWGYGDPLFCGQPRPSETRAAVAEATRLGAPSGVRSASGLRILIVGDSTACSLYPGLKAVGDQVGAEVAQASVFGCGIASGHITTTRGEQITPHSERCPAMVDAAVTPAIEQMRPDIVVWMSLWEKSDVIAAGKTLVSGTPSGDAEMLRRMDASLARLTKYGAKVVLVTVAAAAPNDAQGTQNTSNAVDDASYARLDDIDRRFAQPNPQSVTVLDLAHRICPNGPRCPEFVDGMRMRPDGRHFAPQAASIAANWLMPKIVAVARR